MKIEIKEPVEELVPVSSLSPMEVFQGTYSHYKGFMIRMDMRAESTRWSENNVIKQGYIMCLTLDEDNCIGKAGAPYAMHPNDKVRRVKDSKLTVQL